jgi:hypothetical protein
VIYVKINLFAALFIISIAGANAFQDDDELQEFMISTHKSFIENSSYLFKYLRDHKVFVIRIHKKVIGTTDDVRISLTPEGYLLIESVPPHFETRIKGKLIMFDKDLDGVLDELFIEQGHEKRKMDSPRNKLYLEYWFKALSRPLNNYRVIPCTDSWWCVFYK